MIEVRVRDNDIERAVRRFKKVIQKDGILTKLRERHSAVKPSDRRRQKERRAAMRRWRREAKRRHPTMG